MSVRGDIRSEIEAEWPRKNIKKAAETNNQVVRSP